MMEDNLIFHAKKEHEIIKVPKCTFANDIKSISKFYLCFCSKEDFFPICEACAKTCHKEHKPSLNILGIYTCQCGLHNHEISDSNEETFHKRKNNTSNKCFYSKFMEITPNNGYYSYKNKTYCAICVQYCRKKKTENEQQLIDWNDEGNNVWENNNNNNNNNNSNEVDNTYELEEDTWLTRVPRESGVNTCSCPRHFEHNVVNLNLDFQSKLKFHLQLQNFNFNILCKISITEDKYINYLILKIREYIHSTNTQNREAIAAESKEFFSDFINYKVWECFSMFAQRWENKFFHVKNYFADTPPEKLIDLMSLNENAADINEAIRGDFFSAKFYFAEWIFNYLIRTYWLKYNNLWNVRTIINMNLYQRLWYFHKIKDFYKFHSKEVGAFNDIVINNMISSWLDLYDSILKFNDSDSDTSSWQNILFGYIFPTFVRIFKYLIKYNLLSTEQTNKYFELVFDSLKMWCEWIKKKNKDKNDEDNSSHGEESENGKDVWIEDDLAAEASESEIEDKDIKIKIEEFEEDDNEKMKSTFYIMKSILYTLIYMNDTVCLNYWQVQLDKSNKSFVFMKNPNVEKISKVFMLIINTYYRKEDLNRTIIYDFYVRKIWELLISKDNFYSKSLKNLKLIEEHEIKNWMSEDFITGAKGNWKIPYMNVINQFNDKLGFLNRQYFEYYVTLETYIEKSMVLMGTFQDFITKTIGYLPDLTLKYWNFTEFNDKDKYKNIKSLQNVVKYSILFQKMEEYIHIYSEGKTYAFDGDEPQFLINIAAQKELLSFILRAYYMLIYKNPEVFCWFMNIKPKIFVGAFIDSGETLFDFLERICELMFLGEYEFDNYYFISESLCFIVNNISDYFTSNKRTLEKDLSNWFYLGRLLKITGYCIDKITINQPDFINVIDSINYFIELINTETNCSDVPRLIESYFSAENTNESLTMLIKYYFIYLSKLYENDFYFFSITRAEFSLFDYTRVWDNIESIIENNRLPLEVEYAVWQFYFQHSINFKFSNDKTNNQMLRLFKYVSPSYVEETKHQVQIDENIFSPKKTAKHTVSLNNPLKNSSIKPTKVKVQILIPNVSLPNLSVVSETQNNEILERKLSKNIKNYLKIFNFLLIVNKRFTAKFDELYSNPASFTSSFELKIFFFKYIENILIRPWYKLYNYFILHSNIIKGGDCSILPDWIFNFLKNWIYFYKKSAEEWSEEANANFDPIIEKYYSTCEIKEEIFKYENISIVKEWTLTQIQDILEDIKWIKEKVKFYNVIEQYGILVQNIEKVCHIKPENIETLRKSITKSKKEARLPLHIVQLNKLWKKYEKKSKETYDTNLSWFSAIKSSEKEMDQEIGKELLLYLLYKLSDGLTDENYMRWITSNQYSKGQLSSINIRNFKLQNSYVLIYLNALFYNYSESFQSYSSEVIGSWFDQIFYFFTVDIIYASTINEVCKWYTLDRIRDFNSVGDHISMLNNEICKLSIKFLQNMCESHNQIFQNRFFNYRYNIDKMNYVKNQNDINNALFPSQSREGSLNNNNTNKNNLLKFNAEESEEINTNVHNWQWKTNSQGHFQDCNTGQSYNSDHQKNANIFRSTYRTDNLNEKDEVQALESMRYSFFNFMINCKRLIQENLHVVNTIQSKILRITHTIKSTDFIVDIYQRYSDLIIEMVQGTQVKNFSHFYYRLSEKHALFNEFQEINYGTLPSFVFLQHCIEIQNMWFEGNDIFNLTSLPIWLNTFTIIVNVLTQEVSDRTIINNIMQIFPPEKVIIIVSNLLRGWNIKHWNDINYDDFAFQSEYEDFEFGNDNYKTWKNYFKEHLEIYEDPFFKLAGQMYLFLTILGKKYHIPEAERVIRYDEKEVIEYRQNDEKPQLKWNPELIANTMIASAANLLKQNQIIKAAVQNGNKPWGSNLVLRTSKHDINNYIITSKFFNKIIKTCEFVIENEKKMNWKTIYFITDPRVYFISKNNMDKFFDGVNRSSSTTKLKSFLDSLDAFMYEVEFKYNTFQKTKYLKWMFTIDYKSVDFFNFCCSLAINIMLLCFLDRGKITTNIVNILTITMAGFQIFINMIYWTIFLISKYSFYVILSKSKYVGRKIRLMDYPSIYVFDSFWFNEEIYLMIWIIIMGSIGVFSRYASFLFSLQLLTVVKFVATIKEIVLAFKLRMLQLISMIGFLVIFIFFYAALGYNFFSSEFNVETDDGETWNICSSWLECAITYFNQGVRAGGGIGDLLEVKEFGTPIYWVRWFNDLIFFIVVILMLLNMINGVIVSTFSQIREESNAKEEDISNKCFICNIDRVVFERFKIQFKDHQKNEHNVKTYIRFLIYLKLWNEKDLDADQSFIINGINNREIKCFPVNRSLSTGEVVEDVDEDEQGEN